MKLDRAQELCDRLNGLLSKESLKSEARTAPVSGEDGSHRVEILISGKEADAVNELDLPDHVTVVVNGDLASSDSQYVKNTPGTPSQNTDDYGFYPSRARRHKDGPSSSPDVNPNYPGLRRIPELIDLVRRVGNTNMTDKSIASRLSIVGQRLALLAAIARKNKPESETLIHSLLAELKQDGHTGRNKVIKLVKQLEAAMRSDGYFEGT